MVRNDELRRRTWIRRSIEKPGLDSGRLHFGKRLGTSLPSGWQLLGNDRALSYRRCPSGKPSSSAFWRNAPAVRLVSVEIFATGVLAREWALSSWTCCFVHARRSGAHLHTCSSLPCGNPPVEGQSITK